MDQPIEILASNPVYMAVAVVLAIIILLGIIKKLIKLVMVVSAILVLGVAYMVYTRQEVNIESAQKFADFFKLTTSDNNRIMCKEPYLHESYKQIFQSFRFSDFPIFFEKSENPKF